MGSRYAHWLLMGTLFYNLLEAGLALWAGIQAHTIALMGFGLDSGIEIAVAGSLLYRMDVELKGVALERVRELEVRIYHFVAWSFFLLALYVLLQACWTLYGQPPVEESRLDLFLALLSLIRMPLIARAKFGVVDRLTSLPCGQRPRRPSPAHTSPSLSSSVWWPMLAGAGGGLTPSPR